MMHASGNINTEKELSHTVTKPTKCGKTPSSKCDQQDSYGNFAFKKCLRVIHHSKKVKLCFPLFRLVLVTGICLHPKHYRIKKNEGQQCNRGGEKLDGSQWCVLHGMYYVCTNVGEKHIVLLKQYDLRHEENVC